MRQLTALDASFFAIENDNNYGHVGGLSILEPPADGELTLDRVKALIGRRLHLVPPMTQRLQRVPFDLDWPYWVDDEHFDLGYHCRELALPPPGSMAQLAEQTARIYSRRLDRSRPLWELYLIHGVDGGRYALMTKMHHAAIDGMSGAEVTSILYDVSPEPRDVDLAPAGALVAGTQPSRGELLRRTVTSLPGAPGRGLNRLGRLLPHVDVLPSVMGVPGSESISRGLSQVRRSVTRAADGRVIERPRFRPPAGAFDGQVSPHRVFGFGQIPLDEVKRVKDAFGVKVNDVVVALVAGAVRDYLLERGSLPSDPLIAQIPVSVRTEEERGTFGNQISVMFVPIPTHVDGAAERVREATRHLLAAKERHSALPAKAMRDVTQFIPPALHARAARTIVSLTPRLGIRTPFNVIISNVPGPPIDIYTAGARLQTMYPLSIIADGAGLNVTLMSYKGSIDIGITADREQTPDVQVIADGMASALAELAAASVP
jgi:diacylglycerol O-acyltransferase